MLVRALCLVAALIVAHSVLGSAQTQASAPVTEAPPPVQKEAPAKAVAGTSAKNGRAQKASRREGRTKRSSRKPRRVSTRASEVFEPPRVSRDPGPTRQHLAFSSTVLGGYDDNLTAGFGTNAGVVPAATVSGTSASADAALNYSRGNNLHSVSLESTSNLRSYPGYLNGPVAGTGGSVQARTIVASGTTLRASERVGYEPFFNVFSQALAGATPLPGIAETLGLFKRRSLVSNTALSLDRLWTSRDATSFSYSYNVQRFTDNEYGDNSAHDVVTEYRRRVSTGVSALGAYRYVNGEYVDYGAAPRPTREHRIVGGPEFDWSLSSRRHLTVSAGVGGIYFASVGETGASYHSWAPAAIGSAKLYVSPTWSLQGGYERGFSLLRGITDKAYATDTISLATGGSITRRADVLVGTTYTLWRTPVASAVDERFSVFGTSLEMRVPITTKSAAFARYYYYHHRYSNPAGLPAGFPADYDRNAVNFGLTVSVPLVGNGSSQPPTVR